MENFEHTWIVFVGKLQAACHCHRMSPWVAVLQASTPSLGIAAAPRGNNSALRIGPTAHLISWTDLVKETVKVIVHDCQFAYMISSIYTLSVSLWLFMHILPSCKADPRYDQQARVAHQSTWKAESHRDWDPESAQTKMTTNKVKIKWVWLKSIKPQSAWFILVSWKKLAYLSLVSSKFLIYQLCGLSCGLSCGLFLVYLTVLKKTPTFITFFCFASQVVPSLSRRPKTSQVPGGT